MGLNTPRMKQEAKDKRRREKLRDQFAMAALPAVINKYGFGQYADLTPNLAVISYKIADAMLKEKEE